MNNKPAKKMKTTKVDGMDLSSTLYKQYNSLKSKREKADWKSNYKDKSAPPFTEVYDSSGNLIRSRVSKKSNKGK